MEPIKCKQLIDEFYRAWETSSGSNFPPIKKFIDWLKNDDDKTNCKSLIEEFEKEEKPYYKNPNIKTDDLSLATFVEWIRKKIATAKKSSEEDWVGKSLE